MVIANKKVLTCISYFGKVIACLEIMLNSEGRRDVETSVISRKTTAHSFLEQE